MHANTARSQKIHFLKIQKFLTLHRGGMGGGNGGGKINLVQNTVQRFIGVEMRRVISVQIIDS